MTEKKRKFIVRIVAIACAALVAGGALVAVFFMSKFI